MVPQEWTRLVAALHGARLDRAAMRDATAPQQLRDAATQRYTRAVDAIIDDLGALSDAHLIALSDAHLIGRITLLLARKERI